MSIRKKIENYTVSTCNFVKLLVCQLREYIKFGNYLNPYADILNDNCVYVLANGPSLSEELKTLLGKDDFLKSSKFVVNHFVNSDLFVKLQPNYYCLADPVFFKNKENKALFSKIDAVVTWPIQIFVPNWGEKIIVQSIHNPLITITPISPLIYTGYDELKYWFYKKGLAMPSYVNVVVMVEYILLNKGCKDIRLYGVDHTFTDGLFVNENNKLCIEDNHFYGKSSRQIFDWNGNEMTVADYLKGKYLTFVEHENMRRYADYLGARIINCTKNSLIDAYVRLSQIENK